MHSLKFLLAALLLASGPMVAGCYIAGALKSGPVADKSIEVTVSSEREVKANDISWKIEFQSTSNEITSLHEKYIKDRDFIINFLKAKGFNDDEIDVAPPAITDLKSLEWGMKEKQDGDRYLMKARVKISTTNTAAIKASLKSTEELLKQGVILSSANMLRGDEVNPKYALKDTESLEKDLYTQTTHKGMDLAKQMAENLGVKLKGIRQITQERPMEILSSDGADGGYRSMESLKGVTKKVKMQLRMKFNIE